MTTLDGVSLRVAVFTPTFNRAHTIWRVYDSLCAQTHRDFQWIVVDDGSTDSTAELVNGWIREGKLQITLFVQANAGKHVAYNKALDLAEADLFVTLDSDDWFVPQALEFAVLDWQRASQESTTRLGGLRYLSCFADGQVIGDRFPFEYCDSSVFEVIDRFRIAGDKCNFLDLGLARRYRFPVYPGERFVPEGLVWNRLSAEYPLRHINRVVQVAEYQPGGLSSDVFNLRRRSAEGAMQYYAESARLRRPLLQRLRDATNLVRFALHAGRTIREIARRLDYSFVTIPALLTGMVVYIVDRCGKKYL